MSRPRAVLLTNDGGATAQAAGVVRLRADATPPIADVVVDLSDLGRKLTSAPSFRVLRGSLGPLLASPGGWSRLRSFDGFLSTDEISHREALALGLGLRVFAPEPEFCDASSEPGLVEAALTLAKRWRAARSDRATAFLGAAVDIILRTGGRDPDIVRRAVASVAAQSAGRLRVIVVRHGPCDLAFMDAMLNPRLTGWMLVEAPGANRAQALAAGLAQLSAPRFALLDDDDHLLEDHVLHLLEALARAAPGPGLAYADILADEGGAGRGLTVFREGAACAPLGLITDRIAAHAFLADTACLEGLRPDLWTLDTAEDALLVASMLARATPVHSPHATCVYVRAGADGSNYLAHARRADDELSFALQLAPWRAAIEAKFSAQADDPAADLKPFFDQVARARLREDLASRAARPDDPSVALRDDAVATPVSEDPTLVATAMVGAFVAGPDVSITASARGVRLVGGEAFAYVATFDLDEPTGLRPLIVAVQVLGSTVPFGVGLLGADRQLRTEAIVQPVSLLQEIQLLWAESGSPTVVVRRHAADPDTPLELLSVALGYAVGNLLEGAQGDRADAAQALHRMAARARVVRSPLLLGSPATEPRRLPLLDPSDPDAAAQVGLGSDPWGYAASVVLPPEAGRCALRVEFEAVEAPLHLLRVDAAWAAVGERLTIPAAAAVTAWMEPLKTGEAARLILQAGERPADEGVTLKSVWSYP